jgi:hypothetical protein
LDKKQLVWIKRKWLSNVELVDSSRAFPVDNVNQLPGILIEVQLQLAFLVKD